MWALHSFCRIPSQQTLDLCLIDALGKGVCTVGAGSLEGPSQNCALLQAFDTNPKRGLVLTTASKCFHPPAVHEGPALWLTLADSCFKYDIVYKFIDIVYTDSWH